MQKIDFKKERKALDREITLFHFKKAKSRIKRCLNEARRVNDIFFLSYFTAQKLIIREDFEKAIRYLNICIKLKSNDGCSYNDKALCLAELGRYARALSVFDEGLSKDKDCASLYHNKGWLLNTLKYYKQSIIYFKKALELEGSRIESIFSLADSYLKLGEEKQAMRYLRQSLSAIKGKSYYIRAQIEKVVKFLQSEG